VIAMTFVVNPPRRPTFHAFAVPVVREVPRPSTASGAGTW